MVVDYGTFQDQQQSATVFDDISWPSHEKDYCTLLCRADCLLRRLASFRNASGSFIPPSKLLVVWYRVVAFAGLCLCEQPRLRLQIFLPPFPGCLLQSIV